MKVNVGEGVRGVKTEGKGKVEQGWKRGQGSGWANGKEGNEAPRTVEVKKGRRRGDEGVKKGKGRNMKARGMENRATRNSHSQFFFSPARILPSAA